MTIGNKSEEPRIGRGDKQVNEWIGMKNKNIDYSNIRIAECLRNSDAIVVYGHRWLVWDDGYVVYERLPNKKKKKKIIVTLVEEHAVAALMDEKS